MSLDRLLGTWDVVMRHVQMSEPVTGRQVYEQVLDGAFIQLHWTQDHPDFPDALVLISDDAYFTFDVRGTARRFALTAGDESWSIERRDADFWQRSTTRFLDADTMETVGENSYDEGGTWEYDYTLAYQRLS